MHPTSRVTWTAPPPPPGGPGSTAFLSPGGGGSTAPLSSGGGRSRGGRDLGPPGKLAGPDGDAVSGQPRLALGRGAGGVDWPWAAAPYSPGSAEGP